MNVTMIMVVRSVAVDMCMSEFVTILIYMCVFMKMLVSVSVTMFVII